MKTLPLPLCLIVSILCTLTVAQEPAKDGKPAAKAPAGADPPTEYSSAEMLKRVTFEKLPELFKTPEGDGTKAFVALLDFYKEHKAKLEVIDELPAELSERAIALLVKAMEAGPPAKDFFDSQIPLKPNARPAFDGALEVLAAVAIIRADELHERGKEADRARADQAVSAVWTLGRLMFEQSNRVPNKTQGLAILTVAGERIYNWSGEGNEKAKNITQWTKALGEVVEKKWQPKMEVVYSLRLKTPDMRATVGDLLNLAKNDEDIAWRVEAILTLGRIKFMPGRGAGNDAAIKAALEEHKKSDNKLIAEAAKVADAYTKDDVRNQR